MVKINLSKKQESKPEELSEELINEVTDAPEMPMPSEPEPKTNGKKGGVLKYILLIFFALITTGSAYFLYTKGWSLKDISFDSAKSLFTADEASVDESGDKKAPKPPKKIKTRRKLSTITPKDPNATKEKPQQKPKARSISQKRKKVSRPVARAVAKETDGRILLEVFKSIVTSLGEESGDLKLTVSISRVTLAVSLNSRTEAASILRKIRQKWPLSNLRAVRFEHSNNLSSYNYATQFDGSINTSIVSAVSSSKIHQSMKLDEFKKLLSGYLINSGLTLGSLEAKKGVKSKSGTVIPMVITADGANESIILFMDSLIKLDAAYTISRASVLSKDDEVSKMSIYLSLNDRSDKARS